MFPGKQIDAVTSLWTASANLDDNDNMSILLEVVLLRSSGLKSCISPMIVRSHRPRRKQLESGAAKTKEILKTPQQKNFYFLISKNLILTEKKHCGESQCCHNASTGPG